MKINSDLRLGARNSFIDYLRALAVILVITNHYFNFPQRGYLGVDIFFVISGYLITAKLLELKSSKSRYLKFYVARARKILPPLLLTLFLVGILSFIIHNQKYNFLHEILYSLLFIYNFYIARLSTAYNGHTLVAHSILGHLWSIAIEEQFYLIWPFFIFSLFTKKKSLAKFLLLIIFISLCYLLFSKGIYPTSGNYFDTTSRLYELSSGALVALVGRDFKFRSKQIICFMVVLVFSLLLLPVISFQSSYTSGNLTHLLMILTVICTSGLVYLSRFINTAWGSFGKLLSWVGERSYGIYLYHLPVLYLVLKLGGSVTFNEVLGIIITLILAGISYKFIEKPILDTAYIKNHLGVALSLSLTFLISFSLIISLLIVNQDSKGLAAGGNDYSLGRLVPGSSYINGSLVVNYGLHMRLDYQGTASQLCYEKTLLCQGQDWSNDSSGDMWTCQGVVTPYQVPNDCIVYKPPHPKKILAVYGDSLSKSFVPGLYLEAKKRGWELIVAGTSGCEWYSGVKNGSDGPLHNICKETGDRSAKFILANKPDIVILTQIAYSYKWLDTNSIAAAKERINALSKDSKVILLLPPKPIANPDCAKSNWKILDCDINYSQMQADKGLISLKRFYENLKMVNSSNIAILDSAPLTCIGKKGCLYMSSQGASRSGQFHLSLWLSLEVGKVIMGKLSNL